MDKHIDSDWIERIIDGHGGCIRCNSYKGLARITYIGHKNSIQVFGYNVILFFKYLKRLLNIK
jgi:hypothetical protein